MNLSSQREMKQILTAPVSLNRDAFEMFFNPNYQTPRLNSQKTSTEELKQDPLFNNRLWFGHEDICPLARLTYAAYSASSGS